jgi:hypothetical protein
MNLIEKTEHHLYVRAKMYMVLDQMKISYDGKFVGYAKISVQVYESSLSGC